MDMSQTMARLVLVALFGVLSQAVSCSLGSPVAHLATPAVVPEGTPAVPTAAVGETPVSTALPVASEPTLAVTVTPTATVAAALPHAPGKPLAAAAWRTLVHGPGLADMDPAPTLGPTTHFTVVANNAGLNTLRADFAQPANAWVSGIPTGTLIIGSLLGLRRGEGHDIEITDIAVDGQTVNVAVKVTAPGEWQGGGAVYPLHLVAVDRSALPSGPLTLKFVDVDTLGPGTHTPAFQAELGPFNPATDDLAMKDVLIVQTASQPTAGATGAATASGTAAATASATAVATP
jgi:hypothetical protein